MKTEMKRLKILCAALAALALAMGALAAVGFVNVQKLQARLSELEMQQSIGVLQAAVNPDEAAAEFEGGVVTVAEASAEYELLKPYYEMLGMAEADYAEEAKIDVLDMLVQEKIISLKAQEYGVYELDDAAHAELEQRVQAEYDDTVEYYMAFRYEEGKSDEEVREETISYLNENGISYEEMLRQAEQDAWRDRLYERVTADFSISDEQLKEFYEAQLASEEMIYSTNFAEYEADTAAGKTVLWNPDGVRRMEMLLISFSDEQAERYADIQASLAAGDVSRLEELDVLFEELEPAAQAVLEEIRAGADFAALMERYPGSNANGLRISEASAVFGDDVRNAAMALETVGGITEPLRIDEGLCILRYAGDVPSGPVSFDDVADALRENYGEELKMSLYNSAVAQWMSDANIIYHPERF